MSSCQYHPLRAATFYCSHCQSHLCDHCVEDSQEKHRRCFICDDDLTSLGASNTAEPFWRRFEQIFHYPMTRSSMTLIAILSFLEAFTNQIPIPAVRFLLAILIGGMMCKYSFSCLQNSARGLMTAPDINEAYGDGVSLVFRLFIIFSLMTLAVLGIAHFLGNGVASLVGIASVAVLPAVIILFAMNDSIFDAIHPGKVIQLILAIGMPYGLLLAILMMMFASLSLISASLSANFSFISLMLNSLFSNYYMVVTFHLMGYMLFQYQAELGYSAREAGDSDANSRDIKNTQLAKITVLLKEGQYDASSDLFEKLIKVAPTDYHINHQYFEFLLSAHGALSPKKSKRLEKFASRYLNFLNKSLRQDKLLLSYKRLLTALPGFLPDSAHLRFLLAVSCRNSGDRKTALRLLNGLHKQFPDYEELIPAYRTMAEILEEIPDHQQAEKCRTFITRLQQHQQERITQSATAKTLQF